MTQDNYHLLPHPLHIGPHDHALAWNHGVQVEKQLWLVSAVEDALETWICGGRGAV